ncbi:hypothetical protein [Salmonella phage vB_SenS_SB15]|uniref:Uncharacterized protein n=1 Tax=Salmonella phage vB_SenS_SB15 TaxID=2698416 RepID=A0A6B9RGE9_9CAUD|nr:hypothetical protein [Salmonella phage vB_SenS_SB15]
MLISEGKPTFGDFLLWTINTFGLVWRASPGVPCLRLRSVRLFRHGCDCAILPLRPVALCTHPR